MPFEVQKLDAIEMREPSCGRRGARHAYVQSENMRTCVPKVCDGERILQGRHTDGWPSLLMPCTHTRDSASLQEPDRKRNEVRAHNKPAGQDHSQSVNQEAGTATAHEDERRAQRTRPCRAARSRGLRLMVSSCSASSLLE